MATRLRKTRKHRGTVSVGKGRIGKHRKHPSGRGNAGGQHHHRIMMDKYHPGYFGKVGMRHFHWKKNIAHNPTTNVNRLESMVPKGDWCKAKDGLLPVIDLTAQGVFKLLGSGTLKRGIIVKGRHVSRIAEKKLKEAGGAFVISK
eukprot:NODE_1696_length_784_cov_468.412245_g1417_i0.p2 GENE.NODE_1696_length_784_cov_468.412245_g1417_i0~~NODE_1696_length_784_cov_468.412245_g1417_i0.p2  ORF type:complete len:145 (-),score=25.11 NODE_1696_length_784_cov_468.412245_g1417_i0:265-699(-)